MKSILSMLCLSLLSLVAQGHHSQAHFSKQFSQLEGDIVKLDWRNPHVRFNIRVLGTDGKAEDVRIETNSIYYLERAGVTQERINVGDTVRVGGYASTRKGGDFLGAEVLLADGENVHLIRDAVTKRFNDKLQNTLVENKGIFRVWSIPQDNQRVLHTPLTESAIALKSSFDPFNNFSTQCTPSGMPRLMWYPHPYEFVDEGNKIILKAEMYDEVRTIHLDHASAPADQPYSRLGYSTGRWQDGELIVKTTHINWKFYDTLGTPQSDQIEVEERYKLSIDQSRLDYLIISTDPQTFVEPATITGHWLALGETIKPYECEIY